MMNFDQSPAEQGMIPPIAVLTLPLLDPGSEESHSSRTSESPPQIDIMDRYAEFYKLYRHHFGHRYSVYLKTGQEWLQSLREGDEHYVCKQCANTRSHWQCDRNAIRCDACRARHRCCSRTLQFKKVIIMGVMKITESEYDELVRHIPKRKRKTVQANVESDSEDAMQTVIDENGGPVGNPECSRHESRSGPLTRLSPSGRSLNKPSSLDQGVTGEMLQVTLKAFRDSLNSFQTALRALESIKTQEVEESSRCNISVQHDNSSAGQDTPRNSRTSAFTVLKSDTFWDTLLSDDRERE